MFYQVTHHVRTQAGWDWAAGKQRSVKCISSALPNAKFQWSFNLGIHMCCGNNTFWYHQMTMTQAKYGPCLAAIHNDLTKHNSRQHGKNSTFILRCLFVTLIGKYTCIVKGRFLKVVLE